MMCHVSRACGRALLGTLTLMCLTAAALAHPFQVDLCDAGDRSIASFEWSADSTSLYATYDNHKADLK